jgi:membrane-associated phospholipid phosphatase
MHVGFALMLAVPMVRMARRVWVRALWIAYPPVVTLVVVVTANHWVLDAVAGAAVAVVAAVAAQLLFARARPRVWAWAAEPALPAPARAG